MSGAVEFTGKVSDGRMTKAFWERVCGVICRLDGKQVIVSIREVKRRRSNNQNAFYWGVVVEMVTQMFRDAGNYVDPEDVHDFLKLRVGKLAQVIVTPDGEVVKSIGSTAKLSTVEFEMYIEKIRAWAAGFDLLIPLPNETIN
jgi:NinB protein